MSFTAVFAVLIRQGSLPMEPDTSRTTITLAFVDCSYGFSPPLILSETVFVTLGLFTDDLENCGVAGSSGQASGGILGITGVPPVVGAVFCLYTT